MRRNRSSYFDMRYMTQLAERFLTVGWTTYDTDKLKSANIKQFQLILRVLEGRASMPNEHLSELVTEVIKAGNFNLQSFFKTRKGLVVEDSRFKEAIKQVSDSNIKLQELAIVYADTAKFGSSRDCEIISELPDNFAFDSFEHGLVYVASLINEDIDEGNGLLVKPYRDNLFYVKLGSGFNDYGVISISHRDSVWECSYKPYLDSSTNCNSRIFVPFGVSESVL